MSEERIGRVPQREGPHRIHQIGDRLVFGDGLHLPRHGLDWNVGARHEGEREDSRANSCAACALPAIVRPADGLVATGDRVIPSMRKPRSVDMGAAARYLPPSTKHLDQVL